MTDDYLEKNGYRIIERNFRTRLGKIDIVCRDAENLVLVEEKIKIGHKFREHRKMVNKSKIFK